jgi:hypothetical protein
LHSVHAGRRREIETGGGGRRRKNRHRDGRDLPSGRRRRDRTARNVRRRADEYIAHCDRGSARFDARAQRDGVGECEGGCEQKYDARKGRHSGRAKRDPEPRGS